MKKWIVLLVLCILLIGCEDVARNVADPNSSLNVAIDKIAEIAPVVGTGASTATSVFPWAATVLLVTNVVTAVIAVYKNRRKDVVIGGQNDEIDEQSGVIDEQDAMYANLTTTSKAIVDAVEALPDEAKAVVKRCVEEKLKDNDFYKIGKAVISGLKGN